jgi:hypothetical protein
LPFLQKKLAEEVVKQIDKKYFEQLVKNDITLSQEYVEWYSVTSEFYHIFLFDQETQYDCFTMKNEGQVKLFFLRQVIS